MVWDRRLREVTIVIDRRGGALIGLAAGDALGAAVMNTIEAALNGIVKEY